jgi:hypothetical protein
LAVFACSAELIASDTDEAQLPAVELLARVTPTELDAFNATPEIVMLRFVSPETGANATVFLPPFAEVEWQFPAGSTAGVELSVVASVGGLPKESATIRLDDLLAADALWVERVGDGLFGFVQHGTGFTALDPDAPGALGCSSGAAPHVPEISPIQTTPQKAPKKLEPWVPPA